MDTLCLHLIFIIFDSPSFIFCKKTTWKRVPERERERKCPFIHSSWSFAVANYCSLPFFLSFHFFYAVFAITFTRSVLFSLVLCAFGILFS
jgi:hypothetical protein